MQQLISNYSKDQLRLFTEFNRRKTGSLRKKKQPTEQDWSEETKKKDEMLFEIDSKRCDRMILIDLTASFLPLTEIGDIEVKSSEQMKWIQTDDQSNQHRNVGGKKSHMNKVWDYDDQETEEKTAGNLKRECFRVDIEFHHRVRSTKKTTQQINNSWINASLLLTRWAPSRYHHDSLQVWIDLL